MVAHVDPIMLPILNNPVNALRNLSDRIVNFPRARHRPVHYRVRVVVFVKSVPSRLNSFSTSISPRPICNIVYAPKADRVIIVKRPVNCVAVAFV